MKKGDMILAGVMVVLTVTGILLTRQSAITGGKFYAKISIDGEEVERVELTSVKAPYSFRMNQGDGIWDDIEVEPGRIRVAAASCPRQIAVKQGWVSQPPQSIICVPNRLIITVEGSDRAARDIDGVVF